MSSMLTVQCDFDDTVTTCNVSQLALEAFASPGWREEERRYLAGEISVEEGNKRQFALLRVDREVVEDFVLKKVEVRPGFVPFVEYCRESGKRLVVVSNGVDMYIEPVLWSLGLSDIEVHCARSSVGRRGSELAYTDPSGRDRRHWFKLSWLQHLKEQGGALVYIGDGKSDIEAASQADHVIARNTLYQNLQAAGVCCFGLR